MMRSMYSGVSGLKVHQTKMDVIGNNIANVNTVGYKAQRVTFSDVFSQTLTASNSAHDETGRGGKNAMQIGLGVNVSSIDMLMTQGAAQRTDNPFDIMIDGEGFIVVGDSNGQYFTRAGALRQDDDGNLVISNGMKVQGWKSEYDTVQKEYKIVQGSVQDINLNSGENKSSRAETTSKVTMTGNLCSSDESYSTNINIYDSLGNYYSLPIEFTNSGDGKWEAKVKQTAVETVDGKTELGNYITDQNGNIYEIDTVNLGSITFSSDGKLKAPTKDSATGEAALNLEVKIKSVVQKKGQESKPALPGSDISTTGIKDVKLNVTDLTQYATKSDLDGKANGNTAGTLSGYSIGSDGMITATYTNGELRPIAQIPVAIFDNPAGLEKVGDNLYAVTDNAGSFNGIGTEGGFNTGVLEMSNVDLSSEFTDMIVTQRGFQANSKIITVADEMIQELTGLKR